MDDRKTLEKALELAKRIVPEGQDLTPELDLLLEMADWSRKQVIEESVEFAKTSAEAFFNDPKAYEHSQIMAGNLREYLEGTETE